MPKPSESTAATTALLYDGMEATMEDFSTEPGKVMPMLALRFRTVQIGKQATQGQQGATPWVLIDPAMLDELATQLASVAATAKHWRPDAGPVSAPDIPGLVMVQLPDDGTEH